jgi:hypothetical protein
VIGVSGVVTVSGHVASPRKVAVFSRAQGGRGVMTYSPANFLIAWAVANGGKLAAPPSMTSVIFKKYIITSLAGRKAMISGILDADAILYKASPITSATVTNHNRSCA